VSASSILVVDGEPAIQLLVSETLRDAGYTVEAADNGAEALRCVEQRLPSLVILDRDLAPMDGRAFVTALHDRGLDIPILVMAPGTSACQAGDDLDADGYLPKPFELRELLYSVTRLCS